MRHFLTVVLVGAVVATACRKAEDVPDRSEPALIGGEEAARQDLELRLTSLMREFMAAAAAGDSAAVDRYVRVGASVIDTQFEDSVTDSTANGAGPKTYGYYQLLSGRLSRLFSVENPTFFVLASANTATVYAIGGTRAYRTMWSEKEDGWRASTIVLLRPDDARHNLAQERMYQR